MKIPKHIFGPICTTVHLGSMEILVFLLVVVWKSDFRTTPPGFVLSVLAGAFSLNHDRHLLRWLLEKA